MWRTGGFLFRMPDVHNDRVLAKEKSCWWCHGIKTKPFPRRRIRWFAEWDPRLSHRDLWAFFFFVRKADFGSLFMITAKSYSNQLMTKDGWGSEGACGEIITGGVFEKWVTPFCFLLILRLWVVGGDPEKWMDRWDYSGIPVLRTCIMVYDIERRWCRCNPKCVKCRGKGVTSCFEINDECGSQLASGTTATSMDRKGQSLCGMVWYVRLYRTEHSLRVLILMGVTTILEA